MALRLPAGRPQQPLAAPRTPAAARSPAAAATGRGPGDTLTILYWQAPTVLNSHLAAGAPKTGLHLAYEPLASYDRGGNLVPL